MNDSPDTPEQLKARALRHLMRREHSRKELERKLSPHAESAERLQGLLGELEGRKLLSDHRFAESRAHVLSRKYGAARIRQDLKARGVSAEIAQKASTGLGEIDRARGILQRRYRFPADSREELARRARFLQQRGFSHDVIRRLISLSEFSE